jgi:hypothetical protein
VGFGMPVQIFFETFHYVCTDCKWLVSKERSLKDEGIVRGMK